MKTAMIEKNGKWLKGFCDFHKHNVGEILDGANSKRIVVSAERVCDPQGRNWFHTTREATDAEINAEPKDKIEFGAFLEMFADSK